MQVQADEQRPASQDSGSTTRLEGQVPLAQVSIPIACTTATNPQQAGSDFAFHASTVSSMSSIYFILQSRP